MEFNEVILKQSKTLSVLLVDDHDILREGVKTVLNQRFPGIVFGEARNAAEASFELRKPFWTMMIVDISLPDRNGFDILRDARAMHPNTPVLILSMYQERQYGIRALRAGAAGYLTKGSILAELDTAVMRILDGGKYISPALSEQLANQMFHGSDRLAHELLSTREFTIISAVASGKKLDQIARELGLSPKTISTYKRRALTKMQITSSADLYRYAQDNNLI